MTLYVTIFLFGIVAAVALRRLLAVLLRVLGMAVAVLLGGRLMLMADDRLARPEWISGALIGGVAAFVVVGLLSYAIIYHALIAADERRDIEKAHDIAKRRRLW
jgi:hypothetical protein